MARGRPRMPRGSSARLAADTNTALAPCIGVARRTALYAARRRCSVADVSGREPSAGRALLLDDFTLANMMIALRPDLAADIAAALDRLDDVPGGEAWRPR